MSDAERAEALRHILQVAGPDCVPADASCIGPPDDGAELSLSHEAIAATGNGTAPTNGQAGSRLPYGLRELPPCEDGPQADDDVQPL